MILISYLVGLCLLSILIFMQHKKTTGIENMIDEGGQWVGSLPNSSWTAKDYEEARKANPNMIYGSGSGGVSGQGYNSASGGSGVSTWIETIRRENKDGTYYYVYKDHNESVR